MTPSPALLAVPDGNPIIRHKYTSDSSRKPTSMASTGESWGAASTDRPTVDSATSG